MANAHTCPVGWIPVIYIYLLWETHRLEQKSTKGVVSFIYSYCRCVSAQMKPKDITDSDSATLHVRIHTSVKTHVRKLQDNVHRISTNSEICLKVIRFSNVVFKRSLRKTSVGSVLYSLALTEMPMPVTRATSCITFSAAASPSANTEGEWVCAQCTCMSVCFNVTQPDFTLRYRMLYFDTLLWLRLLIVLQPNTGVAQRQH